ncbi:MULTISPECIES: serine/threonine-protein kinase [unclassified Romboutsia]|uniref:serine/threonine-protein kinase n=1 Tax=unclassified Romboutsia TaxID=2626894 RepID=UPI000822F781|nr:MULTISPECIES: serine/threonine-protein kinase [unclassified Romboutsia]SCH38955.1 Serine/threonine-protein kinase PrkC [uncultured Clostridium sp.]
MQINTNINLKILEKINSEGVNSALYIVEDTQLGSRFILKQIDKKNLKEFGRYFDESKKIYKLRHPNIITINHASYDDDYIYIVMPYFRNGSLYNLMQNENLTIREIIKYALDFLQAVYYIHNNNMVHCDIKPNNILISDENRAVLTDFGSSLYLDIEGNAKLKNVYYKHIAPEQCISSTINKKIDIYQIGTTLYRMCNGNEEYNKQVKRYKDLNSLKIACANGKFPVRKKYLPHVPKSMILIIEKCLKVNKDERYDNVLEIMNDLSKIEENLDWRYKKIDKDQYLWSVNGKYISLYRDLGYWNIKHNLYDENENLNFIDTKAHGYRLIRKIINMKKK